jgi:hypothetical protein
MAQIQVIPSQTAAVTTKAPIETGGYAAVVISANLLAGAEEVDIFFNSGGTWMTAADATGTAIKLTASITSQVLEGGPTYAVVKDATVGACGVFADLQVAR